ncbi:MAG: methylmalonyl Co-A mutase-associated GTPase MeaB [bacterium]|jgi:LAO/AO transport system kinase
MPGDNGGGKAGERTLILAPRVRDGCRLSLAKLITMIENEVPQAVAELAALSRNTGEAHIIGLTGPPGAGKSTLAGRLAKEYRRQGKTVGIVAVDPTSPFSGGALLGDRLRMQDLATDKGVFIRSMSTRGSLGGLAQTTGEVIKALDAAGKEIIIVETVGVGQAEVEIMSIADTVVVVTVPGLGDEIQINKAGIMEIGDVFVVNKADRDGAEQVATALEMMLDLNPDVSGWRPPVLLTTATRAEGIAEVKRTVDEHRSSAVASGLMERRRRERVSREITRIAEKQLRQNYFGTEAAVRLRADLTESVLSKEMDPYQAAQALLRAPGLDCRGNL